MERTRKYIILPAFAAIFVSGCALEGEVTSDEIGSSETITIGRSTQESTSVFDLQTFTPVANTVARLDRQKDGHEAEEDTTGLPPGHVAILSYVVYNAPENCTAPTPFSWCSFPDAYDPNTQPSLQVIGGAIVNEYGEAEFENFVGLGVEGAAGELLYGPGITNVDGSEVHYLTTDKGEPIEGALEAQLTTFFGGCDVRDCIDRQFAIFRGPDGGSL